MSTHALAADSRPKLLVLASTYPRWAGDPEPGFVHELCRRLVERYQVTVLCPHAKGAAVREHMDGVDVVRYRYAPEWLEVLVNDGGIVTNLRRRPWAILLVPTFVLAQAWGAWRLIRRLRPAAIHAHWLVPQGWVVAALGLLGVRVPPFLVTSHGADLFALRGRLMAGMKRFVVRRAGLVTVVSHGMLEEAGRLGAAPRVEPMGVDLAGRFRPLPGAFRVRNEILFVGRLVEKKGLRHLLDAMPAILASRPDVVLTVAGFGPELEERRAQARRLGIDAHVDFLGAVTQGDLPALYRRASVLAAPFVQAVSGDQEGLGLVLVEALGCGCPVVLSDLPATRELGPDAPGLTRVPPGDAIRLAATLIASLGADAVPPQVDLARFSWEARAASYAQCIAAVADEGGGRYA